MSSLLALAACMGEETYSVSPSDSLRFSVDTLAFDTIISGEGSSTKTFQVFNHNKRAVRISHIALGQGNHSPFVVNIDGLWLNQGSNASSDADLTISAKDSLRIFAAIVAPKADKDEPQPLEDYLELTLESGRRQRIMLTASSQDVNILEAVIIETDTNYTSPRPYQIFDSLVVAVGATLTLEAGTRLYFHPGASLIVHGKLKARGTREHPVVMRGDRLGNMFLGQPYDRIPGQWGGINFTKESVGNDLTWCDIHSGTYGIRCDSTESRQQKLIIDNSVIHNVSKHAFDTQMSSVFVGNCQITNAGGNCVNIVGGSCTFVHCTIGQFYAFTGGRGVALEFTNEQNECPQPLEQCLFVNSIISGYNDDDIMGHASERYADCAFNYTFKNCLLNTPAIDEENTAFDACLFEDQKEYDYKSEDPTTLRAGNFMPAFNLDALIFPFTLNPASRAVNAGDLTLTKQSGYTKDLAGNPRTDDGAPDMGAYEAQPNNNEDNHATDTTKK